MQRIVHKPNHTKQSFIPRVTETIYGFQVSSTFIAMDFPALAPLVWYATLKRTIVPLARRR